MKPNKWWSESVIYQIYPKSFYDSDADGVGDIRGIIHKLDYIKTLGTDIIWLSPINTSPFIDNGYDISDYYSISPVFGSMNDFDELLAEANNRQIAIMLDIVVNHTSDQHYWFQEAKKSRHNKYRNYYIWRDGVNNGAPNDLSSNFGGSAWEYDETTGQYYLHFYGKQQPDLNWENPEVRKEIWAMMSFWINKGVKGFRLDVIDLIGKIPDLEIKENGPQLHAYLQEMHRNVLDGKDIVTVGETWGATVDNASLYCDPRRKELDMIFQFEHMQLDKIAGKSRWDIKPLDLYELKNVMSRWQRALQVNGWNSLFWNNHDLPRIVSRWGNDEACRIASAKMLATLLHGMKGTPYIYQGEEIGMTNFKPRTRNDYIDVETKGIIRERLASGFDEAALDHALYLKARDNARTPVQWDASPNAGFTAGMSWMKLNENYPFINVQQCLDDKNSVFYHYQKLIALRKTEPLFITGEYELIYEDDPDIFAYYRNGTREALLIICNFHNVTTQFSLTDNNIHECSCLLSNYKKPEGDVSRLTLRPYEAIIYKIKYNGVNDVQS